MVSVLCILNSLLLASVTLAVPVTNTPQPESLTQVEPLAIPVYYNPIRAGVFLSEKSGYVSVVDAQFTVPHPAGDHGAIAIWAGIDGPNCNHTTFATGIDVNVVNDEVSFSTWAVWYPGPSHHFQNFTIHTGNQIRFQVFATSPTTGLAWIENMSTGQSVWRDFSSEYALCEENANWYVEDYTPPNSTRVPFLDFGSVTFTEAHAYGAHGLYGPSSSGVTIAAVKQDNAVLTRTITQKDKITITYV